MKNKWYDIVAIIGTAVLMLSTIVYGVAWNDAKDEIKIKNTQLQTTQEELASVVENLEFETTKSEILAAELDITTEELSDANDTIYTLKNPEYELVYMGDFKLTHYCTEIYPHICGTGTGITATGTKVTAGRTVAVDPRVIPYGTRMYIEGYGWRVAEDCGGAVKNKQIDIAVETHNMALDMGVKNGGIWILVQKDS